MANVAPKKIVVIGGSGFIGGRLVDRLLASGHQVRVADEVTSPTHPDLCVPCEVRDLSTVLKACDGYEVIYNLAAAHADTVRPRSLYHDVNVNGGRNLCAAANQLGISTIIFTSTVAVYGMPDREIDETGPMRPFNDYGRSKLAAEEVHREWLAGGEDRSLTIVRPTAVFGVGNRGNIYNLLRQIAEGFFVMIGNGRNRKSMSYVDNVAAFLEFVLEFGPGEHLYNYADKPDFDMNTLVKSVKTCLGRDPKVRIRLPYAVAYPLGVTADAITALTGRTLPVSAERVQKFCSTSQISSQKAMSLGFQPPVALPGALKEVVEAEFASSLARPSDQEAQP